MIGNTKSNLHREGHSERQSANACRVALKAATYQHKRYPAGVRSQCGFEYPVVDNKCGIVSTRVHAEATFRSPLKALRFESKCSSSGSFRRARALLSDQFGDILPPVEDVTGAGFEKMWVEQPYVIPLAHERAYQRSVQALAVSHRRMAMKADYNNVAYVTLLADVHALPSPLHLPKLRADEGLKHLLSRLEGAFPESDVFVFGGEELAVHDDCFLTEGQKEQFILDRLKNKLFGRGDCSQQGRLEANSGINRRPRRTKKYTLIGRQIGSKSRVRKYAISHTHAAVIVVNSQGEYLSVNEIRTALHQQCPARHEVQVKAVGFKELDVDQPTSDEVGRHAETATRYLMKSDSELSDDQVKLSHIHRGLCSNGGLFSFVMTTRSTPPAFISKTVRMLCDIRGEDLVGAGFPAISFEPMTRREIECRIRTIQGTISQELYDQKCSDGLVSKNINETLRRSLVIAEKGIGRTFETLITATLKSTLKALGLLVPI